MPAAGLAAAGALAKAKERFKMPASARVVSCYEAGRDGFWLHRQLRGAGIENEVVDAASIEVSRRLRHVKTDRLDGERLLAKLIRYCAGERGGWSMVRVPSVEEEDARHLHRELERLKRERLAHRVRIQSLLVTQGVRLTIKRALGLRLGSLTLWDGRALPLELKAELERKRERLALVERQIEQLEATRRERLQNPRSEAERRVVHLMRLGAIGPTSAWLWLRFQPKSALSQWYQARFVGGGLRMRRIGIVALARKLLLALWRTLEDGVMPQGARLIASEI